jgi:hypothetical protein
MERLRSRKAEVVENIDQRRAAARFEPAPDAEVDLDVLTDPAAQKPTGPPTPRARLDEMAPTEEDETDTARLLKAKRQARKNDDKEKR